jgi:hypothetical protein
MGYARKRFLSSRLTGTKGGRIRRGAFQPQAERFCRAHAIDPTRVEIDISLDRHKRAEQFIVAMDPPCPKTIAISLASARFRPGSADGVFGSRTDEAARDYQDSSCLTVRERSRSSNVGELDAETM